MKYKKFLVIVLLILALGCSMMFPACSAVPKKVNIETDTSSKSEAKRS